MENFKQIGTFNPDAIEQELNHTNLWNWLNLRRNDKTLKHYDVDDIVLRFQSLEYNSTYESFYNNLNCIDYFTQRYLPKTFNAVLDEFPLYNIGRVMVAKLKAGGEIGLHIDEGLYAQKTDRYHMVVTSNPNVIFTAGSEAIEMPRGTIWWFNNQALHKVENKGFEDRIHIIVDMYK